jgi:hypothetical protein
VPADSLIVGTEEAPSQQGSQRLTWFNH